MSRTGAWRGACAAGSVTSIRVGSSALLGSFLFMSMLYCDRVHVSRLNLIVPFIFRGVVVRVSSLPSNDTLRS